MSLSFADVALRLDGILEAARVQLRAVGEERAGRPLAPGKWSPKQVLGHLCDSCANNEQRLVRGRYLDPVTGTSYQQDHWVAAHGYAERPWVELQQLWLIRNKDFVEVLRRTPDSAADVVVRMTDKDDPTGATPRDYSLGFIAEDYLRHLVHHLEQIGCTGLAYEG